MADLLLGVGLVVDSEDVEEPKPPVLPVQERPRTDHLIRPPQQAAELEEEPQVFPLELVRFWELAAHAAARCI